MNTKDSENKYIAIILAAGLSSRMDGFKPLADINGKPALLRLLATIEASGLKQAVVVTGHERALIDEALRQRLASVSGPASVYAFTPAPAPASDPAPALDPASAPALCVSSAVCGLALDAVYNPNYESGMFSSVQAGIRYIAEEPLAVADKESAKGDELSRGGFETIADRIDAALLFPADVPLVSAETIRGLIAAYEQTASSCFAVPVYEGKNGHPLLIPRVYFGEILDHTGEGGLKEIRNRHIAKMIRYKVIDEGCVLDIDTPEDHKRISAYEKRQNEK